MQALVPVHIAAACVALLSGTVALTSGKGTLLHRRAGMTFGVSMLVMFTTAVLIGAFKADPNLVLVLSSVVGGYLVATSWATARRHDGHAGAFENWALGLIAACMAVYAFLSIKAAMSPTGRFAGLGQAIILPNLAIAGLAASLDLSFIRRGKLPARQRLARHVWRMCAGLFIVTTAFLGDGQGQSPIPDVVRRSPVLLLAPAAVLFVMIFWLLRLRFPAWYSRNLQAVRRIVRGIPSEGRDHARFPEPLFGVIAFEDPSANSQEKHSSLED